MEKNVTRAKQPHQQHKERKHQAAHHDLLSQRFH
jgi:hypothetical protein